MPNLGAVLDHEGAPAPSFEHQTHTVAGSSAQRRHASARRDEDIAPAKFEGHHEVTLLMLCA
jgi:hypothetical protein